ncbi:MAG: hypothetical protein K2L96_00700 [Muribaculaceae bacterium]|nr:hypothetical protein [Muribaculaceae bacterium]
MRKFYTLFTLILVAMLSFTSQAKSFKITLDLPEGVSSENMAYVINTSTYTYSYFTDGVCSINADDSSTLDINPMSDFYLFASLTDSATGREIAPYTSYPTNNITFSASNVDNGANLILKVEEKQTAKMTVLCDNIDAISVSYNYNTCYPSDGKFVFPLVSQYASVSIRTNSPDYKIKEAVGSNGTTWTPDYSGSISIYCGSIVSDITVTVHLTSLLESRTASMTVNVDGSPYVVKLTRGYEEIPLSEASTVVRFDPETESEYCVEHTAYNNYIYSVSLDGNPVSRSGNYFYFNAVDGSVVDIVTDFPDETAPVSFVLGEGVGKDIINSITINNQYLQDWEPENIPVKLGSSMMISFNNSKYDNIDVKLGSESIYLNSYAPFYELLVLDKEPKVFTVNASKPQPYLVTLITDCPEGLRVYNGYGYNEDERIELTGEETVFEIPSTYNYLTVKAADGYVLDELVDDNGNQLSTSYSNTITRDMTIFASVTELKREKTLTLYVQPDNSDGRWSYCSFTLSNNNYDIRMMYSNQQSPYLSEGYNFIKFADFDLPFCLGGYPSLYAYHNDQAITLSGGAMSEDTEINDGDVIKMFHTEPSSYNVTYDIADDVNVTIHHDHSMRIENPMAHTVLHGTEVVIEPVAEESPVARVSSESRSTIVVKDGDQECNPNAEGKFVIAVTKDTNLSITKSDISGINAAEVSAEGDAAVYNLQGIRVGKASELNKLPKGTYISGGLKVRN